MPELPRPHAHAAAPPMPAWIQRCVPYDRYGVATRAGERIHVMDTLVEDAPDVPPTTVVMCHGNPTWGFLWRKVVRALRGAPVRVILPDLVGLGLSDRVEPERHTLDNHIEWMRDVLVACDVRDAVFVGQDWGGPIGLGAFAREPGRLRGMVVLNTVLGPPKPGFEPTFFHRLSQTPIVSNLVFDVLGGAQRGMAFVQGDRGSIRGKVAKAYLWPLRGRRGNAPLPLARMVPDTLDHPSVEPLREVETFASTFAGPTEIVWGESDPVLGRLARRTGRLLPHAPIHTTKAGHFLQEEVPGPIAAAIRRVVAAVRS